MGETTSPPTTPPSTPPTGHSDSHRARLVVLGVAGLLVVVAAWFAVARHARHELGVAMSTPECSGTSVLRQDTDGVSTPTLRLVPTMRCTVTLTVTNPARVPVTLDTMRLPLLGPTGGAAVQVTAVDHGRYAVQGDVDAVVDLHLQLPPATRAALTVDFAFRQDGCTDPGVLTVRDVPTFHASALGWSGTVSGGQTLAFEGTPASACTL